MRSPEGGRSAAVIATMRSRGARQIALAVALVAATAIWTRLAVRPSSDLLNHRELGRRLLDGTFLYSGGLDYPYLPTWALAHAPLALVPAAFASAIVFPFGLASLALLLWTLDRLTRMARPLDAATAFAVGAAAVVLTSRFLIRDLLDGGENLMLTAMVWLALFARARGARWSAAWLLGAAIALKLTAAVFLICLVAWRERVELARTILCAAILIALPVVAMGERAYVFHLHVWATGVWRGVVSGDPAIGVLGSEPLNNLAFRPALGRLLLLFGASASWRAASAAAATAAVLILIAGVAAMLWVRRTTDVLARAEEWAIAGALGLLVSPITWRAHAVAILPACYLLFRSWGWAGTLPPLRIAALAAIAVPGLVLARAIAGTAASAWTHQWSLFTWAFLTVLAALSTPGLTQAGHEARVAGF